MRVNIWIPDKLLKELDKFLDGRSRSAFISDLISSRVQSKEAKVDVQTHSNPPAAIAARKATGGVEGDYFNPVPKPKKGRKK